MAMPTVPLASVVLNRPETSGVRLSPLNASGRREFDSSRLSLRPMVAVVPLRSSGRAVRTLIVAPMPPVGAEAREVLNTSSAEMESEARLAKSKAREPLAPPLSWLITEVGIWRPLSSTRLPSGPTPRTVIFEPSPLGLRSIDTPAMRSRPRCRRRGRANRA